MIIAGIVFYYSMAICQIISVCKYVGIFGLKYKLTLNVNWYEANPRHDYCNYYASLYIKTTCIVSSGYVYVYNIEYQRR